MDDPCRPPPVAVFDSKVIILPTLEVGGFSSDRVPDSPVMEDAALTVGSTPTVCVRVVGGAGEELLLNKLDIGSMRDAAAGAFEADSLEDAVG
mmetsp:Transcript_15005/g.25590  ORF Transcript_15005/g.25590 Transcript_15005/m.25590 type:complete len:93 (+) Transcript_15005:128-406(+)